MPSGSAKKQKAVNDSAKKNSNCSARSGSSTPGSGRARKRKRCEVRRFSESDLESELEDCNLEDAVAIENKLRKVAKDNDLSDEEMRRLLQKFVKNEHILALVTLQAEGELARERQDSNEQPAIIITDTPSVPKLTRAKARELNKTPGITLSPLNCESKEPEIASLIQEELHSDEDDEEYVFKEEDFASDEDTNTSTSDMDSNPRTPQTPLSQAEIGESPVKFTADGCFKIPLEKPKGTPVREDVRIAARTRSKLCLQQTTIEDIESEFVPPDVEQIDLQDMDFAANDEDWMQFLNDFTKPLNSSFITDDDDLVNDPEYVAAERITEDAEELRDINIPKNELTELVAELFEGLLNEGISLESVELDTPQKFLESSLNQTIASDANNISAAALENPAKQSNESRSHVTRQLNFDNATTPQRVMHEQSQTYVNDVPPLIPLNGSVNVTQNCYSFQPVVMSTPAPSIPQRTVGTSETQLQIPVAYSNSPERAASQVVTLPNISADLNADPEWIAVKIPGQNNSYQLARVIPAANAFGPPPLARIQPQKPWVPTTQHPRPQSLVKAPSEDTRYGMPYDTNFTYEYISTRKHIYAEYKTKYEKLSLLSKNPPPQREEEVTNDGVGFTKYQHDLLQQQLRIHVQMLTQTFLQTYSHPIYWRFAPKVKGMLTELEQRAQHDASYNAWNLKPAMKLLAEWEDDLKKDTPENKEMMKFIHKEIQLTNRNSRQVLRFPARIMDMMLNSKVFMYPQYLPRIPFSSRGTKYEMFSPAEEQLLAMGLEKHIKRIRESGERISKKTTELKKAVLRLAKDTVFGKSARRIWAQIKTLRNADYYNPVKYYFEHKRAPPVEHELITFTNNRVYPPKSRYKELPLAWQTHLDGKRKRDRVVKASEAAGASYLQFVREALGEEIQLPDSGAAAVTPNGNESASSWFMETGRINCKNKTGYKSSFANSVTINVNYNFSGSVVTSGVPQSPNTNAPNAVASRAETPLVNHQDSLNNSIVECIQSESQHINKDVVSFNFDWRTRTLQPIVTSPTNNENIHTPSTHRVSQLHGVTNTPVGNKLRYHKSKNKNTSKRTKASRYWTVIRSNRIFARYQKRRRQLRKRFLRLLTSHREHLNKKELPYKNTPIVLRVYRYFRALELYTNLLGELKMACRNAANTGSEPTANEHQSVSNNTYSTTQKQQELVPTSKFCVHNTQSSYFGKRSRAHVGQQQQTLDEEANAVSRSKKASRQEENFRHMLLPDTPEDANRKDAIYAFNFYEKVEEALKASNRAEDCKRFNHILKTFDPHRDKVSDLYYKLERLFLPEHPELAEVFLTFLLPSEAAEIGKFFEHFMINNMTTFINKLNIYFNKQPAQIRKIYNSLAELAEDPEVTMKKVETKILPLLKGNQFLIDWFLQQFAEAKPPERIFTATEQVNLKEVEMRPNLYESLNDPHDAAASCCEIQQQQQQLHPLQTSQANNCQLRYINGRIFYGNKMTLPAKLSFMATNSNTQVDNTNDCDMEDLLEQAMPECVHGIREHGEKRLTAAVDKAAEANAAAADCSSDDNERSEEEDVSKVLIIDTTNEDDSNSSIETCDDAALRVHAMRLNPSYYGNTCFAPVTSTPNTNICNQASHHHQNAKRSILNFNDDGKAISPRKHPTPGSTSASTNNSSSAIICISPNVNGSASSCNTIHASAGCSLISGESDGSTQMSTLQQLRDRRKSPTKKSRSPLSGAPRTRPNMQPMVVIYERNSAIACAKKLKSLIEEEDNESEIDNKERLGIVACVKHTTSGGSIVLDAQPNPTEESGSVVKVQPTETRSASPHTPPLLTITKVEQIDNSDDMEFIPENAEVTHSLSEACINTLQQSSEDIVQKEAPGATESESYTEDCKLDVVATLATSSNTNTSHMMSTNHITIAPSQNTTNTAWTREEDKLILIEMKLSAGVELEQLFKRMQGKLPARSLTEIKGRYQFLMDFLSKLQGK
ncbi:uncharacterized protein mute [Eurosta solidaginis]|uniref:uncharacterized protein mute n=1 Tax=Eurosta solidaginis TaxID=178769 RepID=UPI0035306C51